MWVGACVYLCLSVSVCVPLSVSVCVPLSVSVSVCVLSKRVSLRWSLVTDGGVSELAITTLLSRCQDVLKKYVSEERLAGRRPLPRLS